MQATVLTALLVGAAACHTSAAVEPDGTPNGIDGSASSVVGLSINWSTSPQMIPGNIMGMGNDITVTSMLFRMMDVRLIGDAGPGDPRTTQDNFQLSWASGAAPPDVVFANAPSGLYSKVSILADGELIDYSYEIDGTVKVANVVTPYKIHDRSPIPIDLDTNTMLDPGKGATVNIVVQLDHAISSIDFTKLGSDNGTLDLDTLDNQMSDFRTNLIASFAAHGGSEGH